MVSWKPQNKAVERHFYTCNLLNLLLKGALMYSSLESEHFSCVPWFYRAFIIL